MAGGRAANRSRHLPRCHGDGLPAVVQGWTQIRAPEWAGGVCSGWDGDGQDDGATGQDAGRRAPKTREAGTQRREGTEVPSGQGRSWRVSQGGETRRDARRQLRNGWLSTVSGQGGWVQQGGDKGALPVHGPRGHRPTLGLYPAEPAPVPPCPLTAALPPRQGLGVMFRLPQSPCSAATGSQAPRSLPGQAGSQAQLRAGTPAASAKQLPVPLGWLLGQSHHRHAQPTTASGWIEARCRAPLRSLATRRLPHCRQPCPLCRTGTGKGPLAHKHLPITSCVPGLGRHQGKTSGLCSAGPTAHAPPSPGSGPGVPQPFPRGVLGLPSAEALAHST